MNRMSGVSAVPVALFLVAGAALAGCQRPSVEEAVSEAVSVAVAVEVEEAAETEPETDLASRSPGDHAAHLPPAVVARGHLDEDLRAEPHDVSGNEAADLARIRAGTALYQQFDRAVAGGFVDPSGALECVAHPEFGGMGIHFVSFDRYAALEIDPSRPEILLYEPREDGSMRLVGVEFAVNAEAWHAAGNEGPPSVAGATYDPPNPGAESPIVQTSYTLHVWTWQSNPNGRFFPFNPRVRCPVEQASAGSGGSRIPRRGVI